jgi:hypothetical protein
MDFIEHLIKKPIDSLLQITQRGSGWINNKAVAGENKNSKTAKDEMPNILRLFPVPLTLWSL